MKTTGKSSSFLTIFCSIIISVLLTMLKTFIVVWITKPIVHRNKEYNVIFIFIFSLFYLDLKVNVSMVKLLVEKIIKSADEYQT